MQVKRLYVEKEENIKQRSKPFILKTNLGIEGLKVRIINRYDVGV